MAITKKDMHNVVLKYKRLKLKDGEAEAMLDYFTKMTEDNQNFFHMHRLDTDGSLKDILWIDARSRASWEEFGDVVCFDATYLTNEYELPFANFVGKSPIGILTDQAAAMRKALSIEMPEARHRWCLWHITYKFAKKLGAKNNFPNIKKALLNAIYNSLTEAEFEESWTAAIGKFKLQEDTWLSGLYEEREMWVPAYMKHLFWAGMKTTQRVESINSFFDGYLDKHTRLYQFGPAYMKAMESRANDEQQADANSHMYLRTLATGFAVEKTFQLLYTDAKFKEVQKQCTKCLYVNGVSRRAISEDVVEHTLEDRIWMHCDETKKEKLTSKTRCYQVMVDMKTLYASCVCKMFECEGIVCRHVIKALDMEHIRIISDMFVLRRWKKNVQRKHTMVKVAYHDPSKTGEVKSFDEMMDSFKDLCLDAAGLRECVDIVLEGLAVMKIQCKETKEMYMKSRLETPIFKSPSTQCTLNLSKSDSGVCSTTAAPKVKDPVAPKKAANRPRETRFLSCVEKPKKKVAKKKEVVTNKVADGRAKPTKKVAKGANKQAGPKEKNAGPSKFGQDKDADGMEVVGGHKSIGGITCNEGSIGYFTRMLQGANSEQPNIVSGDQCHDMLRLWLG
ncbi:protein FAR1-RELATED SEQUENCE 5-like [Beta vulgaris subsp. vulgaris]|uniref:protein FAR1-RELATED SEQUENCE 5-like n=1 Tax=Beta vulgaris subsp. vulgaris TaxID=3555 RepID=UPI002546F0B7|nr:protein FAR1-RELATED SEQUENCE 5-like [Beta vulgaris subsp. vulgaris]